MSKFHSRSYPTPKRLAVGSSRAGQVAPAWKQNSKPLPTGPREGYRPPPPEDGAKILINHLPLDVGDGEVDHLLADTIGPLLNVFVIYDKRGQSRGLAVAQFKRVMDARRAQDRYNGKIIDGNSPLKIELIGDAAGIGTAPSPATAAPVQQLPNRPLSLMERLQLPLQQPRTPKNPSSQALRAQSRAVAELQLQTQPLPHKPQPLVNGYNHSKKVKKGPRRVKKIERSATSVLDLDRQMDEYRRAAKFGA